MAGLTATSVGPSSSIVVKHPTDPRYFRVSTGTLAALSAMDGTQSIDQLSRTLGVSPRRLDDLVAHLGSLGLLENGPETRQRPPRHYGVADPGLPRWFQRVVFLNLTVLYPDRLIARLYRTLHLRRVFGAPGLGLFMAAGLAGMWVIATRPELLANGVRASLDPRWSWLVLLILFVKRPMHEIGHALACRHYNQPVGGLGVGFYLFIPVVYVDASSAWMLPDRKSRVWVHLAGFMADFTVLFVALLAMVAFPASTPAQVAAGFLLVVVGVSVIFNLNPMLKLDGYFILCDALGLRNLRERAFGVLLTQIRSRLAGLGLPVAAGAYPAGRDSGSTGLILYAWAALAYTGGMFLWAAWRLSSWLADTWRVAPLALLLPYLLATSMFGLFVYFVWRGSVTSSYRRF